MTLVFTQYTNILPKNVLFELTDGQFGEKFQVFVYYKKLHWNPPQQHEYIQSLKHNGKLMKAWVDYEMIPCLMAVV